MHLLVASLVCSFDRIYQLAIRLHSFQVVTVEVGYKSCALRNTFSWEPLVGQTCLFALPVRFCLLCSFSSRIDAKCFHSLRRLGVSFRALSRSTSKRLYSSPFARRLVCAKSLKLTNIWPQRRYSTPSAWLKAPTSRQGNSERAPLGAVAPPPRYALLLCVSEACWHVPFIKRCRGGDGCSSRSQQSCAPTGMRPRRLSICRGRHPQGNYLTRRNFNYALLWTRPRLH